MLTMRFVYIVFVELNNSFKCNFYTRFYSVCIFIVQILSIEYFPEIAFASCQHYNSVIKLRNNFKN